MSGCTDESTQRRTCATAAALAAGAVFIAVTSWAICSPTSATAALEKKRTGLEPESLPHVCVCVCAMRLCACATAALETSATAALEKKGAVSEPESLAFLGVLLSLTGRRRSHRTLPPPNAAAPAGSWPRWLPRCAGCAAPWPARGCPSTGSAGTTVCQSASERVIELQIATAVRGEPSQVIGTTGRNGTWSERSDRDLRRGSAA